MASKNRKRMGDFLKHQINNRKIRLFGVACCYLIWDLLTDKRSKNAVITAENYADGLATIKQLYAAREFADFNNKYETLAAKWSCSNNTSSLPYATSWYVEQLLPNEDLSLLAECIFLRHKFIYKNQQVIDLAAVIYQEKQWDIMPILADALEESGNTDQTVLDHCRLHPVHTRGCWVIDHLRRAK